MKPIQDNTEQLQSEVAQGKAMASLLDSQAQKLSMRTLKRLEESRMLAVQRHANKASGYDVNQNGTLTHWLSWSQHPRLMSMGVLCAALIVGLTLTQHYSQQNEFSDAFLLGSELPPEAFVDRGFEPWLNAKVEL
ncbi:MAG: DUF3619 family protein [Methylophilus sp.]|nr:DUF3619 family protein [Methylophilus sp.]